MGGCRPGPINHNPLSSFNPSRTPGPLGCNDAADPSCLTVRGNTPGCLGINDDAAFDASRMIDPMDFDFLLRHHISKGRHPLVESTQLVHLDGGPAPRGKDHREHRYWENDAIWSVAGAIVFRVSNLSEDVDGSERAYHPPTDASWNGYGPNSGLAKDSLANAVGVPGVTTYAHSKDEKDWALTAGCQVFRDYHKAKILEAKVGAASKAAGGNPAAADKATQEAKAAQTELDKIYKNNKITKLSELEAKTKTAVCVLYVDGRSKADSQADWSHVKSWAGIHVDGTHKPILRASGPNKGFYIPKITPGWANADKHPWVVRNHPQDNYGVNLTNSAVVIKNGDSPSIAYGMVGDVGPKGHLGEVSRKMIDDLGFSGASPAGDYILIQFPQKVSDADIAREKDVNAIRRDAQAAFEAWTWQGRSGLTLVQELFPTPATYHRALNDYAKAKQYLNVYVDHMALKLK
jgi:hypothetical protein